MTPFFKGHGDSRCKMLHFLRPNQIVSATPAEVGHGVRLRAPRGGSDDASGVRPVGGAARGSLSAHKYGPPPKQYTLEYTYSLGGWGVYV